MKLTQNIKTTFKGVFRRFKELLCFLYIYTLKIFSSLNNRLEQKSIINIMLTNKKHK